MPGATAPGGRLSAPRTASFDIARPAAETKTPALHTPAFR
jgi:hypothetical protein